MAGSCFNDDTAKDEFPSATDSRLLIDRVHNGFGRLLPFSISVPTSVGTASDQVVDIRSLDDLIDNRPSDINPVLFKPDTWPTGAENPAGNIGNHFIAAHFTRPLNINSVLDPTVAGFVNFGLTGTITVTAYDPATGLSEKIPGRGFVNGYTYTGNPIVKERWVSAGARDSNTTLEILDGEVPTYPGTGFPGTEDIAQGLIGSAASFPGANDLIHPNAFVYVVDSDDDLSTYESFPTNRIIRMTIAGAETTCVEDGLVIGGVRDLGGKTLEEGGIATASVGADNTPPVLLMDGLGGNVVTCPTDLAIEVPCDVQMHFFFSESCQPHSIGPLPADVPPALDEQFNVEFYPPIRPEEELPGTTIKLPYTVLPVSPYNFTEFVVTPSTNFPGSDPYNTRSKAKVSYFHNAAQDIFGNQDVASQDSTEITFDIGSDCTGLVNAPVSPGVIYVASDGGGSIGGMRVIDLDGFGQGTGDPQHDFNNPVFNGVVDSSGHVIEGDVSKFPFNPNLQVQGIFPPLSSDDSSIAGGSAGVFTLAKDTRLSTQLVSSDITGAVSDMMIGHPLDLVYNNFDCLSGGQNNCASTAYQSQPLSALYPLFPGNNISMAPHPNPPRLRLAPSCYAPLIQTEEPSFGTGVFNLLKYGDAFGTLNYSPPSGLLTMSLWYEGFYGPSPPAPTCPTFSIRQQVGHFLYLLNTTRNQIVVLNSNRMTVLDTIGVSDPRDLAISPDMNILAVSNKSTNSVTFIDTNPTSPTFHEIIKVTSLVDASTNRMGQAPTEIVWQPDDEDVLVLCEKSHSMALISTSDLEVRKIIPGVNRPKLLAVTNRWENYVGGVGWGTGLYYAYVISEGGQMTIFESGPDGVQGIGYDDFVGKPSLENQSGFDAASCIQPNPNSVFQGVYIAYRKGGKGAIGELYLKDAPDFPQTLAGAAYLPDPNRRAKEWTLLHEWVDIFSSSSIVDIALDDLDNTGGTNATMSAMAKGAAQVPHSSKSLHRAGVPVSRPRFLFAANANGKVDVIQLSTGTQYVPSIEVPGVKVLCHYWRQ